MKLIAFIPARLESKRFPNKILRKIYDLPMVEHVRRRAIISKVFDKIYVVTNSTKVKKVINALTQDVKQLGMKKNKCLFVLVTVPNLIRMAKLLKVQLKKI